MTRYAKDVNGVLEYPRQEEFPGVPNFLTHDAILRKKQYLPLAGEPEDRDGYTAEPAIWHKVTQSETRVEPRQVVIPDYEEDEETHERRKVGEHTEMRDTEIIFDTSYLQIDSFNYIPIPIPEPVLPRQFSKGDLLEALMGCNLYEQAKAIYAEDLDLQIAWAGFSSIDMDFTATQSIMEKYPQLFTEENVLALQTYISEHAN